MQLKSRMIFKKKISMLKIISIKSPNIKAIDQILIYNAGRGEGLVVLFLLLVLYQ